MTTMGHEETTHILHKIHYKKYYNASRAYKQPQKEKNEKMKTRLVLVNVLLTHSVSVTYCLAQNSTRQIKS